MADVRLIAAPRQGCAVMIVLVLAACADAGAQPPASSGIKPPAGWTPQPAIASAAKTALGKNVDGVEAFGEPAMGCYSVWMAVRGSGKATELAEQLVKSFDKRIVIKDLVKPTADEGVLSLGFEHAPVKGRLRARIGKGKITALACWANQREPAACEQACTTLLGALP